MSDQSGTALSATQFNPEGRAVEAGRGVAWISEGWTIFTKNPGVWIGQMVVLLIIFLVLSLIPFLGHLAINLLMPVFGAGLLLGCRVLSEGGTLEFNQLFEGFKKKTGELILIGVLLLVGGFLIMLVAGLIIGGGALTGMMMGNMTGSMRGAGMAVGSMLLGALVALALSVPLAMASWFAVPLVLFHNVAPFESFKLSFAACLKNIVPFLLFGIVAFVLAIFAAIPFGLGFLVLGPVLVGATYASYRDIFVTP
jgi:hypothetical protein